MCYNLYWERLEDGVFEMDLVYLPLLLSEIDCIVISVSFSILL